MRELTIGKNEAGQRLDKYLKKLLSEAPGSFIYKMLRKKNIVLNEKKATGAERLAAGDRVKLYLSDETYRKFSLHKGNGSINCLPPVDLKRLPFPVLYENEDILLVNKPAGMLSQKAKPEDISANEYILSYLAASGAYQNGPDTAFCPSVCNRLDRNTSGILIAGKTLKGLQETARQLKAREIEKYYRCIVAGNLTEPCHIKGYLRKGREENKVCILQEAETEEDKWIETEYVPVKQFRGATLLEVRLITGRTHQIRAHLASVGHPVLGDTKYGTGTFGKRYTLFLHAYRVCFPDGTEVTAPLPDEFGKLLDTLESESGKKR